MCAGQTLRALVNERLTAAAEDIFVLFERTIAEYEEQLCRSKKENERKQQLLDSVLSPRVLDHRADVHSFIPELGLNQEISLTPLTKEEPEEQSIKQEEEFIIVTVKSEDSLLPQIQTEHREETQGEDCGAEADTSLDPHGHLYSEPEEQTDNDEDWDPPASSSAQQMETEAEGDDYKNGSNTTNAVTKNPFSGSRCGAELKDTRSLKHLLNCHTGKRTRPFQCSVCKRSSKMPATLQTHVKLHTGSRPHSCTVCEKTFIQFVSRNTRSKHTVIHNKERPFCCSECSKEFNCNAQLDLHLASHTGVRLTGVQRVPEASRIGVRSVTT